MKKICIDMDGVLFDFIDGCCKVHELENPYLSGYYNGQFAIDKIWGMSANEFWSPLGSKEFWSNLILCEGAEEVVTIAVEAVGLERVILLSSPSWTSRGDCIDGKIQALQTHFPQLAKRTLFGGAKEFCAGANQFLIDDYDKNVDMFYEHGGTAFLVPRYWNRNHSLINTNWLVDLRQCINDWKAE